MEPAHRLIICGAQYLWFTQIQPAHRNPRASIYEIDLQKKIDANQRQIHDNQKQIDSNQKLTFTNQQLLATNQKLLAANQQLKGKLREIGDACFLLLEKEGSPGQYYLTIIDRKDIQTINSVRWILKDGSNYWRTGKVYPQQLHRFVATINGKSISSLAVHHKNFFTFDNRNKNLLALSKSAHRKIHKDTIIEPQKQILTDGDFFDFIQTVF